MRSRPGDTRSRLSCSNAIAFERRGARHDATAGTESEHACRAPAAPQDLRHPGKILGSAGPPGAALVGCPGARPMVRRGGVAHAVVPLSVDAPGERAAHILHRSISHTLSCVKPG